MSADLLPLLLHALGKCPAARTHKSPCELRHARAHASDNGCHVLQGALLPDPSVIGKYQVTRRLAQGGMGTLYLARDPVLDRPVAIKVIRGDFDDPALRERFAQEAQSVSRLRHPNIVTIFEYGEFDGQPFLAMEYIEGETVGALIRRREPLPLARKLQMMDEICAGMAAAHRARVVHRDLKPDNIMVDAEGGAAEDRRLRHRAEPADQRLAIHAGHRHAQLHGPGTIHGGHGPSQRHLRDRRGLL